MQAMQATDVLSTGPDRVGTGSWVICSLKRVSRDNHLRTQATWAHRWHALHTFSVPSTRVCGTADQLLPARTLQGLIKASPLLTPPPSLLKLRLNLMPSVLSLRHSLYLKLCRFVLSFLKGSSRTGGTFM